MPQCRAGADEIELTYYLGRACYFLGYADRDEALLARASAAFESVLAHNPADGDAYDHLGRVRYYQTIPMPRGPTESGGHA